MFIVSFLSSVKIATNGAEICEVLKISERSEEKFSEFLQISCCTQCRSEAEAQGQQEM
jgi:hypothetical protein